MRLRDGLRVLRRDDTEVQVGTDPRWAVRLTDLLPGEADLLCTIDPATDLRTLPGSAAAAGSSPGRVAHLVLLLEQAGLTTGEPPGPRTGAVATATAEEPDDSRAGATSHPHGRHPAAAGPDRSGQHPPGSSRTDRATRVQVTRGREPQHRRHRHDDPSPDRRPTSHGTSPDRSPQRPSRHGAPARRRERPREAAASRAGAPDAVAWSLLRPTADGPDVVAARAGRAVAVSGLGPTGLGLCVALAAAGVGTVLLDDERPVRPDDVGVGGYRWTNVGAVREQAAARVLRDVVPTVTTTSSAEAPDVLVLVESEAADPARGPLLVAAGVTHLSVVVHAAGAVVGPLVVPGDGPCLRCLDLHRADADPAWPALALQLHPGPADSETGAGVPWAARTRRPQPTAEPAEVGTLAAVCAGLAAAAVLARLDGAPHPLRGATAEVTLPGALPRWRRWSVHPECGCTHLPVAVPAG